MKKLLLLLILLIPINVCALSSDYEDKVYNIVNQEKEEDKINLYLFEGAECPHCKEERQWLNEIKDTYNFNFYEYEIWHNKDNVKLYDKVQEVFDSKTTYVPYLVVGNKYFVGFSDTVKGDIENTIKGYLDIKKEEDLKTLPFLGKVNIKEVSLPIVSIVLGFIDGFNPCAMWILLFLISMLINMQDKKKRWFIGLLFLISSGLVYFLSMLGINVVLSIVQVTIIRNIIALFILIMGILSLRKYIINRKKDVGCTVVKGDKRKKITNKILEIAQSKSFLLASIGIIVLAFSVNLVELACSLGFPVVFSEILAINNVSGFLRIMYLLLYILFYMLDDIIVFIISMVTLEATGITNKYNKVCTLVSAIIMIILGALLLFKPEWAMLNF